MSLDVLSINSIQTKNFESFRQSKNSYLTLIHKFNCIEILRNRAEKKLESD